MNMMRYLFGKAPGLAAFLVFLSFTAYAQNIHIEQQQYQLPVLINKKNNPILRVKVTAPKEGMTLSALQFSTQGTTDLDNIRFARIYACGTDTLTVKLDGNHQHLFSSTSDIGHDLRV